MAHRLVIFALGVIHVTSAGPAVTLQDLEIADDTMSVGSYIREVRAAAPPDYHKSYENEGDGEIGYSRKKQGGGKKGYQHFDSYHKKAGDHYEFEKQDSYGQDEEEEAGAHSHRHEQREKPQAHGRRYREAEFLEPESPEGAYERIREYEEIPEEELREHYQNKQEKRKNNQHRVEDNHPHYEELKEGASDGNGGQEAQGHDPQDYILPEKYTWGEGDNYNY